MQINELTRPRNTIQLNAIMKQAGYEILGSGNFGQVFHKGDAPYILKVFEFTDNAYIDYVRMVLKNSGNPHFPKFHKKLVKISWKFIGIRMEPLTPYDGPSELIEQIKSYLDANTNAQKFLDGEYVPDAYEEQSIDFIKAIKACTYMEDHPLLKEACDLIRDNLMERHYLDIKRDNLMMRGDIVVITDPIWS